jgi:hypothetical protein
MLTIQTACCEKLGGSLFMAVVSRGLKCTTPISRIYPVSVSVDYDRLRNKNTADAYYLTACCTAKPPESGITRPAVESAHRLSS